LGCQTIRKSQSGDKSPHSEICQGTPAKCLATDETRIRPNALCLITSSSRLLPRRGLDPVPDWRSAREAEPRRKEVTRQEPRNQDSKPATGLPSRCRE